MFRLLHYFLITQQNYVFSVKQHNNRVRFQIQKSAKNSKKGKDMETAGEVTTGVIGPVGGIVGVPLIAAGSSMDKYLNNLKVNFQATRNCVTQKQPYDGVTTKNNEIIVKAGRKSSKYVANCFNSWIPKEDNTFDKKPKKLNFAVEGRLTISNVKSGQGVKGVTLVFDGVVLAQGNASGINNWWFGGTHCKRTKGKIISCTSEPYETVNGYATTNLCFSRAGGHVAIIHILACPK